MTAIAHLALAATETVLTWRVNGRRGNGLIAITRSPSFDLAIRKNPATGRFELLKVTHSFGEIFIGAFARQMDAKRRAATVATEGYNDYTEAFNARQEAHFLAPTAEAKVRLERWERNVNQGHREQALLGAWAEAEEMDFELAHA
jgi:hypothetical protein